MLIDEQRQSQYQFCGGADCLEKAPPAASAGLVGVLWPDNIDADLAYGVMVEGLVRVIFLRDQEIEKHSRRVTAYAMKMARRMCFPEEELVYLRWGALLHDIGKIGIPDEILRKPGPLTDEEWKIMRKHPTYAYQVLAPVPYLQRALDIPYCHHEKWDGSGYPQGLKGEEIPLAARIFAAADVWDALTSARPYRPAWEEEKALSYILEQSGKHFDPQVVDVFMGMR